MPFRHACFISYRFGREQLMATFLDELYDALKSYLEPYLDLDVYMDKTRLRGGDFFDPTLANELCHSMCMILVYTPKYFDRVKTFCAREYKLMEQLEQDRLALLGQMSPTKGLILPILFKGGIRYLPPSLKTSRHHYDFSGYRLSHSPMICNEKYEPFFEKIAEYVYELFLQFERVENDPCEDCDDIRLPADKDVQDFLRTIIPPFPGR